MTREELLRQEYEEITLKILMDYVAQAEGMVALAENERLLQDPEASVPESVQRRAEETIRKAFDQRKKAFTHRSLGKGLKVAAIAAILLAMLSSVVFAASPAVKAKVINTIKNVYETHTDVAFSTDNPPTKGLEIIAVWLPDGFSLLNKGSISSCTWENYSNEDGTFISIEKSVPVSAAIDTEDAVITSVVVQGFDATLVDKGDIITVFWLNTEESVVYYVDAKGISVETVLEIAESFS